MATRLDNLTAMFSNVKTRSIIILAVIILGLVLIVGFLGFHRANQATNSAQLAKASNLQSVPGLQATSPQYAQVQQEVNQQNYQQASQTQGTAIPTIVNQSGLQASNNPDAYNLNNANNSANGGANGSNGANGNNGANGTNGAANTADANGNQKLSALEEQQKQQLEAMQKQLGELSSQQEQQQQQQTQASMQKEAQQLLAAWNGGGATPNQQYVQGQQDKNAAGGAANGSSAQDAAPDVQQIGGNTYANSDTMIKAGTILFATLDTAVNSDEPGPIMATIVGGQYKGAKLIGSIQKSPQIAGSNGASSLVLNFSTMSIPYLPDSIRISAVAIDPDSARTALASDVNHHYLERYGSLFASSFLEGWGNEIASSGQSVFVTPFGGTVTTQSGSGRSNPLGAQNLAAGLGTVGTNWGQELGDSFNRQNTVTINAGISMGLLFLNDVSPGSGNTPTASNNQPVSQGSSNNSAPVGTGVGPQALPTGTTEPAAVPVPSQ